MNTLNKKSLKINKENNITNLFFNFLILIHKENNIPNLCFHFLALCESEEGLFSEQTVEDLGWLPLVSYCNLF